MKQPKFRGWTIPVFLLVLVSLACSTVNIPFLAPTPTPTPPPLPPTLVETVPQMGSELGRNTTLLLLFSTPMERASVEAALTSDFSDGFLFSWADDSTLALTPKSAYPSDGQVTFTLAASAKAANGFALPAPLSFSYKTAGPLRVAQVLPAPQAVDISPDSAVVVSFNQPVTALGADPASLPAGFSIEPAAQGKGEWLNTSTYIFYPDPTLTGGADYRVRVNPQLVATSGATLDAGGQNTTWSFRTSLPRLLSVTPGESDGLLGLDPELQLTFNQPMERASVEAGFAFSNTGGKVDGAFTWNDKSTLATFKPSALLTRDTAYTLFLSGQSRSRGGATLGSDAVFNYQSVPAFGVLSTPFANGTTHPFNKSVSVTFTTPIADYANSELESLVTITPPVDYPGVYVDTFSENGGQTVYTSGFYTPGQRYTITFSKDLKDRWGQTLGQDYVFTFRERDADPAVNFSTSYYSIPAIFMRPESPLMDVQAVNVSQIHVILGSFSLADFFRYQGNYDYQRSYTPHQIDSWNEQPDLVPNQNQPYSIDLAHNGQSFSPGLYFVDISSRDVSSPQRTAAPLLVSNVNLTVKTNGHHAFVWAVDLRTQTPVANAPITMYDNNGNVLASGISDANGIWQGDLSPAQGQTGSTEINSIIHAVLAQPGDDLFGMAADNWNLEIGPYAFGLSPGISSPQPTIYIYTERPVYRPGDTVHYRGIIRSLFDGRYSNAGVTNMSVALDGINGKATQDVPVSAYGSFNGEFKLSPLESPGFYGINATPKGDNDNSNAGYITGQSISFQVADYRKPEINLSVSLTPDPAVKGQTLTGNVNAAYFFGAPVSDLPFTWYLYKNPSYFDLPGYTSGLYKTSWYSSTVGFFGQTVAEGQARTGADGSFSIPLGEIQTDDIANLTLEITASESGGFPVSARATTTLHPAGFYAGIRPATWFGRAGSELGFDLLTVDLDKKALPDKALTATFNKVTWTRNDLAYNYTFTPTYTPLGSQQVATGADGKAHVAFTPPSAGTYMLEVSGDGAKSQALVWVSGAAGASWPNLPYQRMELSADQEKYKPGDTAAVFIPGAFDTDALALVTTERSSVLSSQVVRVPPEGYTFNLPISDDQAPNTYVSVTMLGPNSDFRQGYINLPVEPSAFTLNVALKATPEKAGPGDQVTLDLTVTDSKGQPVQAEFSMAVVDLAALALADPNSQDILPAYYDIQPLGIATGLTDAVYARRGLPQPPGGRGGGGGGEEITIREKFPDTAYWKADILTDAQGKAQITFTLPDSLTTWQVDTRGLTQDTKVGQARVRVVTGKELLIRPQTPRFLVVGDHAELAAFVNNTTSSALDATVSLQATYFSLDDPATVEQKVQVPANGRVRVTWKGQVKAGGDALDAIFTVKAGGLEDASRPGDGPIHILHYSAPQTFSTAGVLADAATRQEIIAAPKSFQPLGGALNIELSPSLASVIVGELQADTTSPADISWNNERLVSDFLPRLETYLTLKDAGLASQPLSDSVTDDIRRLLTNQNPLDHGWAWTAGSQQSDPYLTAYILFALNQASKANLDVELDNALQNAYDYVVAAPPFDGQTDLNQPWALNRAVFQNYVLQQIKSANLDTIDTIYAGRGKLDPWARALLADTLLAINPGDTRANSLLSDLQSAALRSASGAHWESNTSDGRNPNSPLLTTSMVVYILAQRDPSNTMLADTARYLVSQRGASQGWGSSYERTWITLALDQYMKASGELQGSFSFSAALNGASLAKGQASPQNLESVSASAPLAQMYPESANSLQVSREAGAGKLYYRAVLRIDRPVESAPALNQGVSVSREFLACNGNDCQPVNSYQMTPDSSGRVKVRLTVTLPHDAYYLMVEDYIPGGADILDSSLKTSQQGEPSESAGEVTPTPQYDNANPFREGWGWWYFNTPQIYSDHILWSADYLPAGTYALTYTIVPSLPGQYHVLPAHAWQAYFPEVQGTSAGSLFEIVGVK